MPEGKDIYGASEGRSSDSEYVKQLKEDHADALLKLYEDEIKLQRFKGTRGYTDDDIEHDVNEVDDMERRFKKNGIPEHKMLADILETIIYEHGELSEWLGSNCEVIKTSRYDDYTKGVDLVEKTETEREDDTFLALGMDASYGSDLHKKFDDIREGINNKNLGSVKYFSYKRSNGQEFIGQLINIPHVVVGVGIEMLNELRFLRRKVGSGKLTDEQLKEVRRRKKLLARHSAQMIILREKELQLAAFAKYAATVPDQQELATAMRAELNKTRLLLAEKEAAGIKCPDDDPVLKEIERNLEYFNNPNPVKS